MGMRIQNERSGSSSLFAHPMAIEPIPEAATAAEPAHDAAGGEVATQASEKVARGVLEARMEAALAELGEVPDAPSATVRQGHLALLKRWYYRPENRRPGEIFFPDEDGGWPIKALLRGVGRVFASALKA
jgi:excinuclease ABC subunit C